MYKNYLDRILFQDRQEKLPRILQIFPPFVQVGSQVPRYQRQKMG